MSVWEIWIKTCKDKDESRCKKMCDFMHNMWECSEVLQNLLPNACTWGSCEDSHGIMYGHGDVKEIFLFVIFFVFYAIVTL